MSIIRIDQFKVLGPSGEVNIACPSRTCNTQADLITVPGGATIIEIKTAIKAHMRDKHGRGVA